MSIYRQHEDPWELEKQLAEAKERLAENPENEDFALDVHELEERVNFAWQDDECEEDERREYYADLLMELQEQA
jgi:hypothetical protein